MIGGYAVGYHGYPRATNDLDVWVAVHSDNAERLVDVLQAFGFSVPMLSKELFLQERKVVRMGMPPMRIEILTSISGVTFEECYADRITDEIDDIPVNLIDLEHLKQNKKASGRYKDLSDLEHLP
ncbi:MAG: hypothetical protein WBO55_10155 [Rhizobiaceae bacterium]